MSTGKARTPNDDDLDVVVSPTALRPYRPLSPNSAVRLVEVGDDLYKVGLYEVALGHNSFVLPDSEKYFQHAEVVLVVGACSERQEQSDILIINTFIRSSLKYLKKMWILALCRHNIS